MVARDSDDLASISIILRQARARTRQLEAMTRRIIKENNELKKVIEYFNDFHDGFVKSIRIVSGNKFDQRLPWEKPEQYESNEDKLYDTGLYLSEMRGLFIEIHHYNYDWPNKPPDNKIILYLKNVKDIDPTIIQMVGEPIVDCETTNGDSGLGLILTFEVFANNRTTRVQLRPLEFETISIEEKSRPPNPG